MRSVSDSTKYEPPSGSIVFVTPVSSAMICCVRSATRTASSRRQRQRLVMGVGVQRLRAAQHPRQRLDRRARDVVERLLRRQRHAGGLRVEAHQPRLRLLRAERLAQLARPDPARRAVLGDLLEEVDVRVEEERQPRREVVDVHPARDLLLDVGQPVLERERELLRGRRARLADVVAADRDRVPARHVPRAPLHHVPEQAHRRIDREAPLLLGDVLLEDVRLDRARSGDPPGCPSPRPRRRRRPS